MNVSAAFKPVTDSWRDRWLSIAVVIAIVILVATLAFAAAAAFGGWSASDNSGQVARQSAIANCRTEKYGRVIDASTQLDLTSAELQVLLSTGLAASVDSSEESLLRVVTAIPVAAQAVTDAAADLSAATDVYVEATSDAAEDPSAFLLQCNPTTKESP